MRLDDYLVTRVVEQVVHLDDLARSIGCDGFADARRQRPPGAGDRRVDRAATRSARGR